MKGKILEFEELSVGMKVCDDYDNVGFIKNCSDIHNIEVSNNYGYSGIYCLVKNCTEPIEIQGQIYLSPQYGPLYEYIEQN